MDKGTKFTVLDHGYVQLVDYMGGDERVIEAARMSTGAGFITWDPYRKCPECGAWTKLPAATSLFHSDGCSRPDSVDAAHDQKLLAYLWKNRHHTPFEMVEFLFKVKAPIFIWRQWQRHRAANYNEESARYGQLDCEFYYPTIETLKRQSTSNKQGGSATFDPDLARDLIRALTEQCDRAYITYEDLLRAGVTREQARLVLPVNIYSTCMVKTNLRMALHFLGLRDDSHAQGEMQQYGSAVASMVKAIVPRTYALYEEHTKYTTSVSRSWGAELIDVLRRAHKQGSTGDEHLHRDIAKVLDTVWKLAP